MANLTPTEESVTKVPVRDLDRALALLAGPVASPSRFFDTATLALTIGLGCRWAAVASQGADCQTATLLSFAEWAGRAKLFSYDLRGTPCEIMYKEASAPSAPFFVPDGLAARYPEDTLLEEIGARSYRGELFMNAHGIAVGHVFVMDDKPMVDDPQDQWFFRLVTHRIGSEFNRWQAERELERSRKRLQRAAQLADLGYWIWNEREDKVEHCSDELASILGFATGAQLVTYLGSFDSFIAKIHPDDRDRYRAAAEESRRTKSPLSIEYRVVSASGDIRCVREVNEKVLGPSGEITHSNGIIQDVTDQRRAQETLKETQSLMQAIADHTPAIICLKNLEGNYTFVNKQLERKHGIPSSWFIGKSAHDIYPEETAALYEDHDKAVIRSKSAIEREQWTPSTEGLRLMLETKFPVLDDQGRIAAIGLIGTDITERREAEENEAMLQSVLDSCPVPITMTRVADGTIVYETPAAKELFGSSATEPRNALSRWIKPDEREKALEDLRRTGNLDGTEFEFRRADGKTFVAALSARLIAYRGEPVIVACAFDMTERHEFETELSRQREIINQSEKLSALGELLASVSHELNNPLTALLGQASILEETAPDQRTRAQTEKIRSAANRCALIVKTFLKMARHEATGARSMDVAESIEASLELTTYALKSSGIDLSLDLASNLPPVMVNPEQLRQVITNLIINAQQALEAIDGPRELSISAYPSPCGKKVVIRVADNGLGIPENIRHRIFEPMFTTKKESSGTGIGLTLSHRIITAYQGTITVDNAPGSGAVFTITLPVGNIDAVEVSDMANARAGHGNVSQAAGCRILVIDDEPDVRETIAEILEVDGHRVETANSGAAALQRIEAANFDLILSDIRMPDLDGPGLLQALQDRKPEIVARLAFITGDTMGIWAQRFLQSCRRPFLEKPISRQDIRNLVARVTERQG